MSQEEVEVCLLQALGPRATLVHAHRRQPLASAPKKGGVTPPQGDILVGVNVDPAAALQLRDMGPPADDVQVRCLHCIPASCFPSLACVLDGVFEKPGCAGQWTSMKPRLNFADLTALLQFAYSQHHHVQHA